MQEIISKRNSIRSLFKISIIVGLIAGALLGIFIGMLATIEDSLVIGDTVSDICIVGLIYGIVLSLANFVLSLTCKIFLDLTVEYIGR